MSTENRVTAADSPTLAIDIQRRRPRVEDRFFRIDPQYLVLPRGNYHILYAVKFGDSDYIPVAQTVPSSSSDESCLVLIRTLRQPGLWNDGRQIQHRRFLAYDEDILFNGDLLALAQFMPVSLAELAGSPLINELVLASIIGQVLEGLSYLEGKGLEHGRLSCSNIFVDASGNIKLSEYEYCQPRSKPSWDIRALGRIMMKLMQGFNNDGDEIDLDDPTRWPSDSDAIDLVHLTTRATEISQLLNVGNATLPY
ncbi:serine threonine protein kinase [Verticillium dahliae]